jgi:hypothetical protein
LSDRKPVAISQQLLTGRVGMDKFAVASEQVDGSIETIQQSVPAITFVRRSTNKLSGAHCRPQMRHQVGQKAGVGPGDLLLRAQREVRGEMH